MRRLLLPLLLLTTVATPARAVHPSYGEPIRTLLLIRHGEYDHADESADEGGLVALGRQQARLVAARLDAMPVEFTSIQCSSMTRARQTAEIIAERLGGLELAAYDDIRECTPTTRRQDIMDDLEPGEAEGCEATLAAAWARLARPASEGRDENDVVVCHGNVIRWFLCQALGVDPTAWLQMSIANCSLTVVQIRRDGSAKVISFADSGHVPWDMTTYPGTTVEQ